MKKVITIFITFFLAFSLCSCSSIYTDEQIREIRNAAYEEGYSDGFDIGFDDGREFSEEEDGIDLDDFRDHMIYDSGLREAQHYVEEAFRVVEAICAADDYTEDEDMEHLFALLDDARGYLEMVESEILSYDP